MLGLSSGLIKGASTLRSIVKSGLQAWYKSDRTQAPLGEEQIANSRFKTGPNLLPNISDFSSWGSVGAVQVSDGIKIFGGGDGTFNYILFAEFNWGNYVHDKTYVVRATVTGGAGSTGKKFRIQDNTANTGGLGSDDTKTTMTEGVTQSVEFYFTTNNSSNTLALARHTSTGSSYEFTVNSLTLNEINPNDSWSTTHSGWIFKDGFAEYTDGSGTGFFKTSNNVVNNGNKYKLSFDISGNQGQIAIGYSSQAQGFFSYADYTVGSHELEFTSSVNDHLRFYATNNSQGDFQISNISLKEITNSIKDFSPNVNDATLYSGTALNFDGTSDYIRVLNKPVVSGTTLTAAFWIKPNTSNNDAIVLSNGQSGVAGWYIWQDGTSIEVALNNASESTTKVTYASANFYTNDVWQRVVVVIPPNGNISYYKDGELVEIESVNYNWTPARSGEKFVIGGYDNHAAIYAFEGQLADVQIYDKLWTASDVEFDYNNPDKDVFDDQNRDRVITDSLIPSIESSGFEAGFGNANTWGAQQLNDGWNSGSGDAQLFSKSGDSITFGSINSTAQLYPPTSTDTINGVTVSNNTVIDGNSYVIKYTVLGKVGNPNLKIYTGTVTGYVDIPTDVGTHEFQFTHRGTTRASSPIRITLNGTSITISNFSVHRVLTHEAQITEVDCKALYRLNEGAGNRVYDAAPVLGEELLTGNISLSGGDTTGFTFVNGSFANNANSTDDFLDVTSGPGDSNLIQQVFSTTNGSLYSIKVELVQVVNGTGFAIGAKNNTTGATFGTSTFSSTPRVAEFSFQATGSSSAVQIKAADSNERVQIKNVSVKEITLPNSAAQADWAFTNWIKQQPYIPQYATSSYSKKMIFDGETDNVNCGSDSSIDDVFDGGGTWSCWISPNNFGEASNPDIIVKGNVRVRVASDNSGNPIIRFLKSFSGDNGNWRTDDTITFSKLTHVAVTYNSNSISNDPEIYVNGIKKNITKTTTPSGSASSDAGSNLFIGGASGGGNNYEGFVDEISIFNKILTQAEVKEIFNAGTALDIREHSAYSNVVAYWRNNGIETWTDLSNNTNDGTVFNNYSEEVLNGIFSNTNNWTAGSGANLSVSDGHLVVECPATDDYVNAHQQLN